MHFVMCFINVLCDRGIIKKPIRNKSLVLLANFLRGPQGLYGALKELIGYVSQIYRKELINSLLPEHFSDFALYGRWEILI